MGYIYFQVGRIVGGAVCDRSWGPWPLSLIILTTAVSVLPAVALPFCLEYWTFILSFGLVGFFAGRIFLSLYFLHLAFHSGIFAHFKLYPRLIVLFPSHLLLLIYPVRLYCHLLGLGVLSISIPISQSHFPSPVPVA